MSTNPDELVNVLSAWLAGHVGDAELRTAVDRNADDPVVAELQEDLRAGLPRARVQVAVREALEALVLGG
jgi:hypothetical protein